MSPNGSLPGRLARSGRLAAAAVLSLLLASPAPARDEVPAHRLRVALKPPACARPSDLPIAPNGPGALVTERGTHCYGQDAPELELRLPESGYVWLERSSPSPRGWSRVAADPDTRAVNPPALGVKLAGSDGTYTLEVRQGRTATLTPLDTGAWQEVTAPDGQRLWVRLESERKVMERGRVRR